MGIFLKRLGIGRHTLTALRRRGLPVRMIGTRTFIDGQEAIDMLRKLWQADEAARLVEKRSPERDQQ